MSRRHASISISPSLHRLVGTAMVVLLAVAALLPASAVAQSQRGITDKDIQWEWQLLTQRDAGGDLEDVPAGVGATLLLREGAAFGEGACSSYDSNYSSSDNFLSVFVAPEDIEWRECDPDSRSFDDVFYDNLAEIASIDRADSVLVVRDAIGQELMKFTRAAIENDPTLARWQLARIGGADGSVTRAISGLGAWMEFLRGGSLVGSSGCGSFLGKYSTNAGRIDITDVDHRLVACTDGAQAQAERMLATFDEITDFNVAPAGLALTDELGTTRLALTPNIDLAKRTWTPIAIFDENGKTIRSGNELTTSAVKFIGGAVEGRSICRPFTGTTLRSGLAISMNDIPKFYGKYCQNKPTGVQIGDVEEDFVVNGLQEASSYALRGSELTLADVNGVTRMLLEPQPPLTGTTWVLFNMRDAKNRFKPPIGVRPITATFEEVESTQIGVVEGKTGAADATGVNEYFGNFRTPTATRIEVLQLDTDGKACLRNKAKTAQCKQEARYLKLLQSADGYIARDDDLKLFKGRQSIINFKRERLDTSDQ